MEIKSKLKYIHTIGSLSCLLLFSCSFRKEIKPPVDLINTDTMSFILSDLSLSETILTSQGNVPGDTLKTLNVLDKYHISAARFDSSFMYYSKNPRKLKAIYTHVLENLNKKQP